MKRWTFLAHSVCAACVRCGLIIIIIIIIIVIIINNALIGSLSRRHKLVPYVIERKYLHSLDGH